jgi:vacuolar protein sorting-associated protein IST1
MFSSKPKFDGNACKVQLKMLVTRLNLLNSKKSNLAKVEKRAAGMLLRDDKEHNARILVEQIIRDDYTIESYELIKQYVDMLLARFNVIITEKELKPEVADAVCALVYSGWLMGSEIKELQELFKLFSAKYGKAYTQEVLDNKEKYINARLLTIISNTQVPDPSVIEAYLTEIAKEYGVEYVPRPVGEQRGPVSATVGVALPTPGMPMPGSAVPDLIDLGGSVVPASGPGLFPSPGPGAAAAPPLAIPTEIPIAQPLAQPLPVQPTPTGPPGKAPAAVVLPGQSSPVGVPTPYSLALPRLSATGIIDLTGFTGAVDSGFGFIVDGGNVIVRVDVPSAQAGATTASSLEPGDRLLSVNGQALANSMELKPLIYDVEIGATASFAFLRLPSASQAGGSALAQPVPATGVALPAAPQQPSAPPAAPPEDIDDVLAKRLEALRRQ